jgi:hypothetical protein
MIKKLKNLSALAGVVLALFLVWVFRPYEKPNMDEVIPELKEMEEPFKSILSSYYLDGGTVGILLVDSNDRILLLSLPAPAGEEDDQYKRLFIGAMHYSEEGAREVQEPHATKVRLAEILRANPEPDREIDIALAYATGRWSDFWRLIRRIYITKPYESNS